MIYQWKAGAHQRLDPQIAGERLEALRRERGALTAGIVLTDARPKDSPLHDAFEWSDKKAAEEYRLEQARGLIRSVVVVHDKKPDSPMRAFVVVQTDDGDGKTNAYQSMAVVMADPVMRAQVLQRARKELTEWRSRYKELSEFAELFNAIDSVVAA